MEYALILGLGLPIVIIAGVWAILRDLTRTSRVATETKSAVNTGLDELRKELIKLRETSTQYDMSVEKTLTDLRQRMDHMESRAEIEPTHGSERARPDTSSRQSPPAPTLSEQSVEQTQKLGA